ncbi:MAG TPA: VWA domain-containing protein [Thermoanaerobaculaceae bacterium]|nr:VWA domain-containing protein [Thermoanaerobaculaceae bacterium]
MSWVEPRWLLLALAAIGLLPAAWALARWRRLQQARLGSGSLWLRWLGGAPATGGARLALWLLAAAAAAVAAAGPRWGQPEEAPVAGLDVVVALDISASMRCADVGPSRLDRAVAVLRQTMDRVPNTNWGLAVGAGDARALVPLTQDGETLATRLADPNLERWVTPGSNLALLLVSAGSLLPGGGPGRVILLASDGEELDGDAAAVADALRRSGIAIVPLVSGTISGGPVPRPDGRGGVSYARDATGGLVRSRARPELMRRLGGEADLLVDTSSSGTPRALSQAFARSVHISERAAAPVHTAPFLLAAALFATGSFLLWPWRRVALVALLLPAPLGAAPPPLPTPSTWQRVVPGSASLLEYRAARAAARGAWEEARHAYGEASALRPRDAALRLGLATAQAREGDPAGERTLAELATSPRLAFSAWYNLGTARLLRGEFVGAAEALRRAVAADPRHFNAWHNLELALVGVAREVGRSGPHSDSESRERLVEAAARAALQPLLVREPPPGVTSSGRDW